MATAHKTMLFADNKAYNAKIYPLRCFKRFLHGVFCAHCLMLKPPPLLMLLMLLLLSVADGWLHFSLHLLQCSCMREVIRSLSSLQSMALWGFFLSHILFSVWDSTREREEFSIFSFIFKNIFVLCEFSARQCRALFWFPIECSHRLCHFAQHIYTMAAHTEDNWSHTCLCVF